MKDNFFEISELAGILDISRRSVQKWLDGDKISDEYLKKIPFRGREGYKTLINPIGCPEPHRSKYIREFFEPDSDEIQQSIDAEAYDNAPGWAKEHVELWVSLIKQFGHLKGKELKAAINAYRESHPDQKVSFKSFYRKKKEYDELGIPGLIPNYGNRRGASKVEDEDFELFCAQYLQESRPSAHTCVGIVRGVAFKNGRNVDEFPSAKTFMYRLEKEYSEAHIYYCRYGKEAYNKKYANYIDRDKSSILANSCWVGDHRVLDILLHDPETGKNFRPWVTAWLDFKTNKILSYEIYNGNPNSDRIFQSFKWAVERYGRPDDSIYIDNGKDYRALDFAGGIRLNEDHARTLVSFIGIEAHFSLPYNAQSKNIERAFKEFINLHEKHLSGYTGSHQKERPNDTNIRAKKGDLLTLEEFEPQFERFIFEVYNKKVSQGKELKGRSPDEAFYSEYRKKIAVRAEALRLMCMRSSKTVTIRRNGVKDSQIDRFYWADWMMNKDLKGQKVYLRRDTKAYQEAWIYHAETDEFLGTATLADRINGFVQTDVERAELKEQIALKRREIKLHEQQRKIYAKNRLGQEDLIDALIANNEATEELRRKRGEFEEYDEKVASYYLDTTKMDEVILKDERMKRTGTEDIDEFVPVESLPKKKLKSIFD